jgi:hypothetical protein
MNHHPYQDWLLDEPQRPEAALTAEQAQELGAHLRACQTCRELAGSLRQVETELHAPALLSPAPGFTARWQARLEKESRRRYSHQDLSWFWASAALSGLLLVGLLALTWPAMRSPGLILWTLLYQAMRLVSLVDGAYIFLINLSEAFNLALPLALLAFTAAILAQLAIAGWLASRLIAYPRRV